MRGVAGPFGRQRVSAFVDVVDRVGILRVCVDLVERVSDDLVQKESAWTFSREGRRVMRIPWRFCKT